MLRRLWDRLVHGTRRVTMTALLVETEREVPVHGESFHQEALERIAGGRQEYSAHVEVVAGLLPEPGNPKDPNAVAVVVDEMRVGYLPRGTNRGYLDVLWRAFEMNWAIACNAIIVGGWDRGRNDRGHFGVILYLATPTQITKEMNRRLAAGEMPDAPIGGQPLRRT